MSAMSHLLLKTWTTEAIMCRLPSSLPSVKPEQLELCRKEFDTLVKTLREIGVDVVELPPDDSSPKSSFVGDVAFVLNGMGVIMKPKQRSENDVNTMRTLLKKELEIPIVEVDDQEAIVEGADILFTGREIFVGLSKHTNEAGAAFIANTFPEYPCSPIKVNGPHHLTYHVNMVGEDVICVGGDEGHDIIKRMEREANYRSYSTLTVPEPAAVSSCLLVNGYLLHADSNLIPESFKVFEQKMVRRKVVDLSALAKIENMTLRRIVLSLAKGMIVKNGGK